MPNPLTYTTYCQWFLRTYPSRPLPLEADFNAALLQPCFDTTSAARLQREYELDIADERRDGYAYD